MKKVLIMTVLAAIAACSGNKEIQEKTIIDYVRETVSGIKPEYAVRLTDITESGMVTVGDSISIIKTDFEKQRDRELDYAESLLSTMETAFSMQVRSSYTSETDKEKAELAVIRQRVVIDSLRTMEAPILYAGRSGGEVLAKIVRAKVSVEEPGSGRTITETYDFHLSPDGKTCHGKSAVR